MPAPPAKETPVSHYTYKFKLTNGNGGTYITDKHTSEEAYKELVSKYGVELNRVWKE